MLATNGAQRGSTLYPQRRVIHLTSAFRHITACLIILVMLLQTFGKTLVFAGYLLNKDYISEVFCINQDVPESDCEGQCHLKKKLDEEDEKMPPLSFLKEKSEVLYFPMEDAGQTCLFLLADKGHLPYQQKRTGISPIADIFHPPQFS